MLETVQYLHLTHQTAAVKVQCNTAQYELLNDKCHKKPFMSHFLFMVLLQNYWAFLDTWTQKEKLKSKHIVCQKVNVMWKVTNCMIFYFKTERYHTIMRCAYCKLNYKFCTFGHYWTVIYLSTLSQKNYFAAEKIISRF